MSQTTVLTKSQQVDFKNETIEITETKIRMFKQKLAETPEFFTKHGSIKKLIESNQARLEMLQNG